MAFPSAAFSISRHTRAETRSCLPTEQARIANRPCSPLLQMRSLTLASPCSDATCPFDKCGRMDRLPGAVRSATSKDCALRLQ
jgi:hypothetical protein